MEIKNDLRESLDANSILREFTKLKAREHNFSKIFN